MGQDFLDMQYISFLCTKKGCVFHHNKSVYAKKYLFIV